MSTASRDTPKVCELAGIGHRPRPMDQPRPSSPFRAGLLAARANAIPGLLIQATILGVLLAYWQHEPTRAVLARVAELKSAYGYRFTFIVMGFVGGILPELLRVFLFQKGRWSRENLASLAFNIPLWGVLGLGSDALYRAQALWFGDGVTPGVVAIKVCVDQFIYTPLISIPAFVWAYEWRRSRFAFTGSAYAFSPAFYRERVLPSLIACWGVWIPTVSVVYCLPLLLQLPVCALATSFWSLVVVYMQPADH